MSHIRILYVKIRMNRIGTENQGIFGADMADLLNISTENRKMAKDFRVEMIINARKNVPLQHVPYFDVQNTDERIETQSHYEVKMRHNQHI